MDIEKVILMVVKDKPKENMHIIHISTDRYSIKRKEIFVCTTEIKYCSYQAKPFAKC